MSVITISRQYASGGSDVAKLVAGKTRWTLIDNEMVDMVAQRAGLNREEVAEREERVAGIIDRLASALALSSDDLYATGGGVPTPIPEIQNLAQVTEAIISGAVKEGNVILVGRGAQAYLVNQESALHVFVVGSREGRIQRAIERLRIGREEAESKIDDIDHSRRKYVKTNYGRDWEDPANYDLCINTSEISLEDAADLIVSAVKQKGWCD